MPEQPEMNSKNATIGCIGMICVIVAPFGLWKIAEIVGWFATNYHTMP